MAQVTWSSHLRGYFILVSDAVDKADTSQLPASTTAATEGQLPDGQWMMQSFADQIPDIGGSKEPQAWAGNV